MPDPTSGGALAAQRAEESVSVRFTRLMNASASRWGVLTDPPVVSLATGVFLFALLGALGRDAGPTVVRALGALAAAPIAVAVVASVALRGARREVVAWLARQPFPVENMNAVLNGLGEALEVTFAARAPGAAYRDASEASSAAAIPETGLLNAELEKVHPDVFVTGGVEDARTLDIRIGVVDSKRNPAVTNHRRYVRVRAIVERALVPLAERYPIQSVRVK
ncbi:hypothetical protein SOCEGT47_037010 [Sorangium cellulosum]|uniref:Uncharacterized protein n=1 Tax=Sorangium cellulosum TaxID=56 RepID=A0A4P2Q248_SORCE|nr:hypothetical protein [Sorangium cellulosum]AUX23181.1 hypothetical protein SOCEGT47_037010 [Sorangium cellulosum]